jgi:hypothetical protein
VRAGDVRRTSKTEEGGKGCGGPLDFAFHRVRYLSRSPCGLPGMVGTLPSLALIANN